MMKMGKHRLKNIRQPSGNSPNGTSLEVRILVLKNFFIPEKNPIKKIPNFIFLKPNKRIL